MKKWPVILCFLIASFAMFWHASDKSATFDEIGHLQAGFYHWRHHDMERGIEHPPLLRLIAALPLNFMDLIDPQEVNPEFLRRPMTVKMEQLYGTLLLYQNPAASAEKILFLARAMMVGVTLLLMALIYGWSKILYGEKAGIFSLFLAATFPPLLGHGTLVNTDVGGAAAALLFIFSLSQFLDAPTKWRLLYCGFTLGLAQACKLSNLILIPISFVLVVVYPGVEGRNIWKRIAAFLGMMGVGILLLNACYRFQNIWPIHEIHPSDLAVYGWGPIRQYLYRWAPLPDFYLLCVGFLEHHVRSGFQTYLFGQMHPQGVWYYFPAIILLRAPALVLLTFLAVLISFKKFKLERREFILLFPPLCYFLATTYSNLNLGIRHIIFIFPFLFVLAGRVWLFLAGRLPKAAWAGLLALHTAEFALASPHYLAFYNLPFGGPRAGIHYSSDLDYGQDLPRLKRFMERNPGSELVLSYFGTGLPRHYGLEYQELLPSGSLVRTSRVNSLRPSKEFLAVSVSQIQGLNTGPEIFNWLRQRRPLERLGYSIHVYDITDDREAHERIAEIYEGRGEAEKAQRERARAKILS